MQDISCIRLSQPRAKFDAYAGHAQVWGIEHTSLIHAYLCVATTPIIIAGGTWILRRPISRGELGGTALGAVGTVLLTLGPAPKGSEVSFRMAQMLPVFPWLKNAT